MKIILITGVSKGIGRAIAERFYREGYQIVGCSRSQTALDELKALLPNADLYSVDMSQKAEIQSFGKKMVEKYGAFDVLINNAGQFLPGSVLQEDDATFESQIAVNLNSAYYLTKIVAPKMMAAGAGSIVNMCSIASLKAYPGGGSYTISKFALLGYSKVLREELKPYGVRVVSVMPGATLTASWDGVDVAPDRLMPSEDIAEIVWTACILSQRSVIEDIVIRPQLGDL